MYVFSCVNVLYGVVSPMSDMSTQRKGTKKRKNGPTRLAKGLVSRLTGAQPSNDRLDNLLIEVSVIDTELIASRTLRRKSFTWGRLVKLVAQYLRDNATQAKEEAEDADAVKHSRVTWNERVGDHVLVWDKIVVREGIVLGGAEVETDEKGKRKITLVVKPTDAKGAPLVVLDSERVSFVV